MAFDLAAYLDRLRLAARPAADAAGLAAVQRAHRLAIPFENLDVLLGRGIAIDGAAVFAKLVGARRGGYCFEHNQLLGDALAALGFAARPLLGRVWREPAPVPPRTHAISLVTLDGAPWIADVGFGGGDSPAMPLAEGAAAALPDGSRFRLAVDADLGWLLERRGPDEAAWRRQYSFTTDLVVPADLALANWWTSTAPDSRFRRHVVVSQALPRGLATLVDRRYRRSTGDQLAAADIADPRQYRMRLGLMFGIDVTDEEVARLGLF